MRGKSDDTYKLMKPPGVFGMQARAETVSDETIGMIGLGHVGLTLGLALADVGFHVQGTDVNPEVLDITRAMRPHFREKGLDELLRKHIGKKLQVLEEFDVNNLPTAYFITVGTPITRELFPDFQSIRRAAEHIGVFLKKGDIVILRSTVSIGTTREVVLPILEKCSGLAGGRDFSLAFAPERTIEGNAFEELRTLPQIVGGIDAQSVERTAAIFKRMTKEIVSLNSLEAAEMVKLVNNTYRQTTFSFANEMSLIARRWGLDAKKIIQAANKGYPRGQVPYPSPGVGGYCLTKDAYLLMNSSKRKGHDSRLLQEVQEVSSTMLDSILFEIQDFAQQYLRNKKSTRLGILGFAFKGYPLTSDVRGSMTVSLLKRLRQTKFTVTGFDPEVDPEVIQEMGATFLPSIAEVLANNDILIIMNNNLAFKDLPLALLKARTEPMFFYDAWGLYAKEQFRELPYVHYRTL